MQQLHIHCYFATLQMLNEYNNGKVLQDRTQINLDGKFYSVFNYCSIAKFWAQSVDHDKMKRLVKNAFIGD